ncbi:N-acyl homoserine lactonase family protein [Conexibacter stalactiti]|uniref:N-acyl homoserine lactonase family protein n=1 Tax=Conexibacter stalactiti TaxID=1940611 RepID=A0ABU4HVL5_9ACTN|nr:N-acyl homoserine lactonase family protein [Conexibacter stalactiti]MDW5596104.1 N-acyl homoserine lactonase family protein [Conexibacter stalactiti]MEC5036746.1 N-acyl homoserine lactonase family protein [Conexibacter stalactiti]
MTAAVCDRLFCLTVGWELVPEGVSLEGGSREILREPVIAIVARSPIGWVLLETGIDARRFRGVTEHPIYPVGLPEFPTGGDPLLDALAEVGLAPGDLALAAVSHLHVDHAGGLRHLAAAGVEVVVQRRELEFALERAGAPEFYARDDYERPELRWRVLDDGDGEIAPGIDAIWTPGHAPGHMSYRVRMAESGTWLFAIDAIDLQRGIDEDRCVGWSADPADGPLRRRSHDRLLALAAAEGARLVPGHCPVTWPTLSHTEGFR